MRAYKAQGMDGLKRRKTKQKYSVQFKLDAVQFILETDASYLETAVQFNHKKVYHIPLQKLVTDITEFKCLGEEKLYLNPILDL
ncbi:hypothetical protein GH754_19475, partial [Salinibacillus xinjiangensis]|nr:hypothetical protein [Salinibacillus xinjiangensis]